MRYQIINSDNLARSSDIFKNFTEKKFYSMVLPNKEELEKHYKRELKRAITVSKKDMEIYKEWYKSAYGKNISDTRLYKNMKTTHHMLSFGKKIEELMDECFAYPIVDVGCGSGYYSFTLGSIYPDRKIIGVDVKDYSLYWEKYSELFSNIDNVSFIHAGIENYLSTCENDVTKFNLLFLNWENNYEAERLLIKHRDKINFAILDGVGIFNTYKIEEHYDYEILTTQPMCFIGIFVNKKRE